MNILYIEHYAGSPDMGMEFRPYYLSREWIKMGHRVDIIAADYSHLRIKNPSVKKDFEVEEIDGINYHWVHTSKYSGNGMARAWTMAQFVGKIYINAKKIAKDYKPDIIITSSTYPLDTYAGQRIKKYKKSSKLIHEIHDMWPAVLTEVNAMSKFNPFVMLMQMAENSFCKNSDYVVSLPPCSKEYLMKHGMKEDKFRAISNGVNLEEWDNPSELNNKTKETLEKLKTKGKFIICFFGSLTNYYALPEIIRAVQMVNDPRVALVFIGDGIFANDLKKIAMEKNAENILFLEKIPKKQIPEMLKLTDALYVGGTDNTVFKYGICMNKLFDSMMSGKPILYAVDAPNNYITEYNCGISVKPGDVEALAEGIRKLLFMQRDELMRLGENGHITITRFFSYAVLAKAFELLFLDSTETPS